MDDSTYKYDIKLFNEQIKGLKENIRADKKILKKYMSDYYYNFIFKGYRNKYIIDELFRIFNGINVQENYMYLISNLFRKYKRVKSDFLYQTCYEIINDLVDFQANRDKYFSKICDMYEVSLSGINYIQVDDIKNKDQEYIKKIDEKFKRVI